MLTDKKQTGYNITGMANHNEYNGFGNGNHRIPLVSYNGNGNSNGKAAADSDEIDLMQLVRFLWNSKKIIAGFLLIGTLMAGIVAYTVTPIYRSEGNILITETGNQRSSLGGSDLGALLSSTYGIGMGSTLGNELQILRSRRLASEIADTLMRTRLAGNGRQFPVLFRAYPDDSTMTSRDTVAMRLQANLSFSRSDPEADVIEIAYESPSPLEAAFVVNSSVNIYSDFSTRHNRLSASSAVSFLKKERSRIEEHLVSTEERLRVFMNRHKLVQVDAQTDELIRQMASLESARQEARVKLVAINSAIEQYNKRLDSIKPGLAEQYADAVGPNMARLQFQLAEYQIEKMRLLANNPELRDQPRPPRELEELNDKINLYKGQIRELTQELMEQGDQYLGFLGGADGNVAGNIAEINRKLIELQVEQQQYRSQWELLTEQLGTQEQFFNNLPDNMTELARLKRDVAINEELFLTVSKQYAEMALWEQTQFGSARPVDPGFIPQKPVQPNKRLIVLVGFILGGMLGVGFVFVREMFNTTIDSTEKLKKRSHPLLAVVPVLYDSRFRTEMPEEETVFFGSDRVSSGLVSLVDTTSPAAEAFRRLQNNIVYAHPDRKLKTIMVTSSSKGEGKSTVCANLAISLAEMNKKVLIIDLDLRRPNMHKLFGLLQSPGVFDAIFEHKPPEEIIQSTSAPGVDVLASGVCPPNPAAVLQSKILKTIIKNAKDSYDYVLVDTAPFGIITDAAPLVKMADGTIVVTRFKRTHEAQLDHTLSYLSSIHARVLGFVFSAFDYEKSSDVYNMDYYKHSYRDYLAYKKQMAGVG